MGGKQFAKLITSRYVRVNINHNYQKRLRACLSMSVLYIYLLGVLLWSSGFAYDFAVFSLRQSLDVFPL